MYATEIFAKYGSYNTWMNNQILDACEAIPDEKRKEDLGAFFGSIHDTLIHILVSDKHRMHQFDPDNGFWPGEKKKEAFADWSTLVEERRACDIEMAGWLAGLTDEMLGKEITTGSWVDEKQHAYPLWIILMHAINHQVHHRGKITTLMWQLGVDFGITGYAWQPGLLESSVIGT